MNDISALDYQAFLVRFWRTDTQQAWRILVKNIQTGDKHHFASFAQLVAFFYDNTQTEPDAIAP